MIPATTQRVTEATSDELNAKIRQQTEENVLCHAAGGAETIDARLRELDHEWDIERMLEANAATLALTGTILGATVDRRWFLLPAVVTSFLLQHAVQGWCPPIPILRRLGLRTATEIAHERYALKALRGDFDNLPQAAESKDSVQRVLAAVRC